jgi:hypothetical protein
MILDELDFSCPRQPLFEDPDTFSYIFNAYANYQNGFLMEEGSVMDQPAKLIKILAIVGDQVVKCSEDKKEAERERTEAHRRRNSQAQVKGKGGNRDGVY